MEDLQQRLDRLESIQAILSLKAQACLCADRYDIDGFADLFAENGRFIGAFQTHVGRETIRRNLKLWPLQIHYVMNPILRVDGAEAEGKWAFLRPQADSTGKAFWVAGWYEDLYAKEDGVWKFQQVKITNLFNVPYEEGWAGLRNPNPDAVAFVPAG
jgi:hypothetical protein